MFSNCTKTQVGNEKNQSVYQITNTDKYFWHIVNLLKNLVASFSAFVFPASYIYLWGIFSVIWMKFRKCFVFRGLQP